MKVTNITAITIVLISKHSCRNVLIYFPGSFFNLENLLLLVKKERYRHFKNDIDIVTSDDIYRTNSTDRHILY